MSLQKVYTLEESVSPQSVGAEMDTLIPIYLEKSTVSSTLKLLFEHADEFDSLNYVYVVTDEQELRGVVSIKELLRSKKKFKLHEIMVNNPVTGSPHMSREEVILLALQHNVKSIPLVDKKNKLVGVYDSDEILEALDQKISDSLLQLSGVSGVTGALAGLSSLRLAFARLPWLVMGVVGGMISAVLINMFRPAIESVILLVLLLPLILGLGANMANQSAMIFIRNLLSAGMIGGRVYFVKEFKISLIIACVISFIVGTLSAALVGSLFVAVVATVSSFFIILVAGFLGVFVPYILSKFHVDAATGSGPFLTIVKDLVVILIYFSVAVITMALLN